MKPAPEAWQEPTELRVESPVSWRAPEYAPISDVTVHVGDITYKLHRVLLWGSRVLRGRSEATIEVPEVAREAIPLMWDYLYTKNAQFTSENALSMYALAKILEIAPLRWLAKEFINKDITAATVEHYAKYNKVLKEPLVEAWLMDHFKHHFPSWEVLRDLEPSFVEGLLPHPQWESFVLKYLTYHYHGVETMDATVFHRLTKSLTVLKQPAVARTLAIYASNLLEEDSDWALWRDRCAACWEPGSHEGMRPDRYPAYVEAVLKRVKKSADEERDTLRERARDEVDAVLVQLAEAHREVADMRREIEEVKKQAHREAQAMIAPMREERTSRVSNVITPVRPCQVSAYDGESSDSSREVVRKRASSSAKEMRRKRRKLR